MKIIAAIEDPKVIRKILEHMGSQLILLLNHNARTHNARIRHLLTQDVNAKKPRSLKGPEIE